ncbi:uncharacterized protein [Rhodnius prolixus]|uniref:uncharacterized protein n=1 Tax=Rhodnius prolixus TaxID=13249 RepID=UPI003D1897FA
MQKFLVLIAIIGYASAAVHGVGLGAVTTQYHAQDLLGQYAYGYAGGPSAKEEVRTADGVTRGGYSYLDGHGLVQSAAYVSDPFNGFRVAATNLPVGPAVPASAPAVVAAAPAVVAAAPAVAAVAPAAVAAPVVVEAKAAPLARLFAGHGLLGLHHLKKRALATVVQPYTNYPGSTAPLVHAPVVHTPVVAAYAAHPWAGLVHALKKRDLYGLGPFEHPYNAARKVAHVVQVHNEGVRNTAGVIPWGSPADNLDVAVVKQAHLHQVAAEGVRNTYGAHPWAGFVHALKKRDLYGLGPFEHPYNAARKVAQAVQVHNEGVRNTVGVIPWGSPADNLDVAVVKQAHLHQVAAEGVRNAYGAHPWAGLVHALKKRDLYGLGPFEHPYNAARKVAQAVQVHNEGVRNTVGVIPWGSPADNLDVAVVKQAHLHQVAAEGVRNAYGAHPWAGLVHALKKRDLYGLGLWDHPYNAARKVAHVVQVHNEGVRNTAGVIPWGSPADSLDVAVVKQAHLHQVAAEGVRNTLGVHPWTGLVHALKKRDLYGLGPFEHPYNAARKVAHVVQVHNEGVRNTAGVIPWGSPADNLDVAVVKQAHLHQVAAEGVRNTLGAHPWYHVLKKRSPQLVYPVVPGFAYQTTTYAHPLLSHTVVHL